MPVPRDAALLARLRRGLPSERAGGLEVADLTEVRGRFPGADQAIEGRPGRAGGRDRHYRLVDDLVVIELDPDTIGAEIRVEDSTGSGSAYPHVYGPIPRRAAVSVHAIQRDASGNYLFSPSGRLP